MGYLQYLLTKRRYYRPTGTYQNEWSPESMRFSPGRGKGYFEGVARGLHPKGNTNLNITRPRTSKSIIQCGNWSRAEVIQELLYLSNWLLRGA